MSSEPAGVLAFDPGVDPVGVFFLGDREPIRLIEDVAVRKGGRNLPFIQPELLIKRIDALPTRPRICALEEVGAMPKQGVSSTFRFGYSAGLLRGVLVGLGYRVELVRPTAWRAAMRVPKGKDGSRDRAAQLWPQAADLFARRGDHNRADAALIAACVHRTYLEPSW